MFGAIRYYRGFVELSATGNAVDRFMNILVANNIPIWNLLEQKDKYSFCISLKNYFLLKPYIRKTKTKVVITMRCGLPFLVPYFKHNYSCFIGFFVAIFLVCGSSLFIWNFEIHGNMRVTREEMEKFLYHHSIGVGSLKSNIELKKLEIALRNSYDDITWSSFSFKGTTLVIQINESTLVSGKNYQKNDKSMEDLAQYGNGNDKPITAPWNGRIDSIVVRSGIPLVKTGMKVKAGDVLVDNEIPIYSDDGSVVKTRKTYADADIKIVRQIKYHFQVPIYFTHKIYTGRSSEKYEICIGNCSIKIPDISAIKEYDLKSMIHPSFHGYKQKDVLVVNYDFVTLWNKNNLKPFVSLNLNKQMEYMNWKEKRSFESAKKILYDKMDILISTLMQKGVQIIEKDVKIYLGHQNYQLDLMVWVIDEV